MQTINSNWLIRSKIKHRHLLVLIALGETGNINNAANGLRISQPAISKLLKELENALEVPLFERHARGIKPTVYGETMIQYARTSLMILDNAFFELSSIQQGYTGTVKIGSVLTPCTNLLPDMIQRLHEAHPAIQVNIQTGSSKELLTLLNSGEIDIIISRIQNITENINFRYEPLIHRSPSQFGSNSDKLYQSPEPLIICGGKNHPLAQSKKIISLKDLIKEKWVLPPQGSIMRSEFEAIIKRNGLPLPKNVITAENLLMITNLLEKNNMLTLLPFDVFNHYMNYEMMARIDVDKKLTTELESILKPYGLIHKQEELLTPTTKVVLNFLRMCAQSNMEHIS